MKKPFAHPLTIIKVIFTIVGLGMLIPAVLVAKNTYHLTQNGIEAQGQVINFSESRDEDGVTYAPIVEFETQKGERLTFTSGLSSYPAAYNLNEVVTVIYPEENPMQAEIDAFMALWFLPLILGGMGIIFSAIGIGIIVHQRRRKKLIETLKMSGRQIESTYSNVGQNTRVKINGRSPFRIHCQYEENGKIYTFESEDIWFNPAQYLQTSQKIIVLVDHQDFSKYYMDISFLPEQ